MNTVFSFVKYHQGNPVLPSDICRVDRRSDFGRIVGTKRPRTVVLELCCLQSVSFRYQSLKTFEFATPFTSSTMSATCKCLKLCSGIRFFDRDRH